MAAVGSLGRSWLSAAVQGGFLECPCEGVAGYRRAPGHRWGVDLGRLGQAAGPRPERARRARLPAAARRHRHHGRPPAPGPRGGRRRLPGRSGCSPAAPRSSPGCCSWPSSSASRRCGRAASPSTAAASATAGTTRTRRRSTPGRSPATPGCSLLSAYLVWQGRDPARPRQPALPAARSRPRTRPGPRPHRRRPALRSLTMATKPMRTRRSSGSAPSARRPPSGEAAPGATPADPDRDRRRGRDRPDRRRRASSSTRCATTPRRRRARSRRRAARTASPSGRPRAAPGGRLRGLPLPVLRGVRDRPAHEQLAQLRRDGKVQIEYRPFVLLDRLGPYSARAPTHGLVAGPPAGRPGRRQDVPRPALREPARARRARSRARRTWSTLAGQAGADTRQAPDRDRPGDGDRLGRSTPRRAPRTSASRARPPSPSTGSRSPTGATAADLAANLIKAVQ